MNMGSVAILLKRVEACGGDIVTRFCPPSPHAAPTAWRLLLRAQGPLLQSTGSPLLDAYRVMPLRPLRASWSLA